MLTKIKLLEFLDFRKFILYLYVFTKYAAINIKFLSLF